MFPFRGTCSSAAGEVVFAACVQSKKALCTFQAKLAVKCFSESRLRVLLMGCSSEIPLRIIARRACIQILGRRASAYLWDS